MGSGKENLYGYNQFKQSAEHRPNPLRGNFQGDSVTDCRTKYSKQSRRCGAYSRPLAEHGGHTWGMSLENA